ncbi:60s ribosomal protein l14-2 [Quercus suber]|uniref:60s ribosomal protein l14-2 n=1 Tax=Quercus suber TaxID=58331 RepID=A0AAW0IVB2_QUESU
MQGPANRPAEIGLGILETAANLSQKSDRAIFDSGRSELRALVDAPDMERSQMNFKRLSLTDIKIDIKRVPKKKELLDAMEKADVKKKWESSSWGRKLIVQKRRQNLTDFDRFKLMLAKIKRAGLVKQELAKLKKENAA